MAAAADGALAPRQQLITKIRIWSLGTQLAQETRKIFPFIGVLINFGYADVEALSPGLAHLPKPFRTPDLACAREDPKLFGVTAIAVDIDISTR